MFGFGKKKAISTATTTTPTPNQDVSTNISPRDSAGKVILTKASVSLEKKISLVKTEKGIDLSNHRARVFVVLDRSGSMGCLFYNDEVQNTLTRLLPLALKFDDNGELEVFLFNNSFVQVASMNEKNFETFVKQEIISKGYGPTGGTSYAPVISATTKEYDDRSSIPAFGIFITDGENDDKQNTNEAIRKSSKAPVFYQFIGIGNERFNYLEQLDDLDGRAVDNTAFVKVQDFAKLSDDELYDKLLEQYPAWLKEMKLK